MVSLHEDGIEDRNSFQSEGEALTERKELNINLTVLNVKFTEVSDIVTNYLLKELGLKQLIFQSVFVRPAQELYGIESDLVLLDVGVEQHITFKLVVNTMAYEVVVKEKLLTKNESEVSLGQELVEMGLVQPNQLVLDILQDGTNGSKWEDIAAFLYLDFLVSSLVLGQVGQRNFRLQGHGAAIGLNNGLAHGGTVLAKYVIASVHNKG